MAQSGGTSRAKLCPSACNDGGKVEVDVLVVLVIDGVAVQLLDNVAVSWQNGKEGALALSGGVGAHHTGDELN